METRGLSFFKRMIDWNKRHTINSMWCVRYQILIHPYIWIAVGRLIRPWICWLPSQPDRLFRVMKCTADCKICGGVGERKKRAGDLHQNKISMNWTWTLDVWSDWETCRNNSRICWQFWNNLNANWCIYIFHHHISY